MIKLIIENTEIQNLPLINKVVNYCNKRECQTLNDISRMLEYVKTVGYIWGRSGSHIWLSQKDGKRIIIFK